METISGGSGNRIAIERFGPRDGPVAILLHGGGQKRQRWRRTGERLATAGWQVLAPDLRGHGDSYPAPDGDYRYDRLSEDLAALIEVAGEQALVVGASVGGQNRAGRQLDAPAAYHRGTGADRCGMAWVFNLRWPGWRRQRGA